MGGGRKSEQEDSLQVQGERRRTGEQGHRQSKEWTERNGQRATPGGVGTTKRVIQETGEF